MTDALKDLVPNKGEKYSVTLINTYKAIILWLWHHNDLPKHDFFFSCVTEIGFHIIWDTMSYFNLNQTTLIVTITPFIKFESFIGSILCPYKCFLYQNIPPATFYII